MVAMMTACNPGDKVIVFSPFYENYAADAILSGAEPIYVPLRPPDFGFDPAELAHAFAQKPKAIVVCNPSNPTGKVFTRDELMEILAPRREARRLRHHRRALRAHRLRAARARLFRRAARCLRADDHLQLALEDLLDHRLAARLRAGRAGGHRPGAQGARLSNRRRRRPACRKPPSPDWSCRTATTPACATSTPPSAICFSDILRQTGLPFTEPQGAYYVMVDISSLGFANDTEASEWFIREIGVAGVRGIELLPRAGEPPHPLPLREERGNPARRRRAVDEGV